MSEHQWGDLADGLRACQRSGCAVLFDPILGLWKRSGALGWNIITRDHPIPTCIPTPTERCSHVERIPLALGPGQTVRGGIKVGQCERPALPRLVVCEYHATPDALRLVILAMAAEIERFKSGG